MIGHQVNDVDEIALSDLSGTNWLIPATVKAGNEKVSHIPSLHHKYTDTQCVCTHCQCIVEKG
eukprot:COSAG02_NODE_8190_length_2668_cov_14.312184_3_plen_63_part_00